MRPKKAPDRNWPADTVVQKPLAELVPYARNSRTHSDEQVDQIAASMREWGFTNPILIDEDGGIIAGHGRLMAAQRLGIEEVPCIVATGWTDAQKRAYVIADNQLALNAGWNNEMLALELGEIKDLGFDLDLVGFDDLQIEALLPSDLPGEGENAGSTESLADKFGIPPFSVLNAREGWWQGRKRAWIDLGIKSELGRGENGFHAAPGGSPMVAGYSADGKRLTGKENVGGGKKGKAKAFNTTDWIREHGLSGGAQDVADGTGTSIFDPVLTELSYSWFCPPGGVILDPFAGGSVRGVVASRLGREYVGIELRPEQVDANRAQADDLCQDRPPIWHQGDSRNLGRILGDDFEADMVFSCPPYADLEVYSDDPLDLSTMAYVDFLDAYREIIAKACAKLKDNRFACFVVGDVRDKRGAYLDFVGDTVQAFRDAGLTYYNEAILVTSVGSLPIRVAKQFSASRKLGKTHQNVLVFCKGDGKRATEACGPVEVHVPEEAQENDHADLGEEL